VKNKKSNHVATGTGTHAFCGGNIKNNLCQYVSQRAPAPTPSAAPCEKQKIKYEVATGTGTHAFCGSTLKEKTV
jgi:hypothetical protein